MMMRTALMMIAALAASGTPLMAVEPLPMSHVTLTGAWGLAVESNQAVLMSINLTSWGCHFTTTANLTACAATSAVWHTYVKNTDGPSNFTHKIGFLAAGDDVKPPEVVNLTEALAFCMETASCSGLTFQLDTTPTPGAQMKCYWKTTTAHFTPQSKKANCITSGAANKPACTPLPGEMGLGGYYGHYQGHWLSATSFLINATRNATVRARADAAIGLLTDVMAAWTAAYGYDGYLFPYSPVVWDKLLAGHGAGPYYSVPFYTLHKLMAGLLDQYVFAHSKAAFDLVLRMALWVHDRVEATIAAGGVALWQQVLLTEWGGMNDVMLELYRHTQDPRHYATARRFNGWVFTARLAAGRDDLADLPFPHANFHLPEIVGNARAYELTGNMTDHAIVHTFFDALTANHSYCTGGSNSGECWQQPRDLGNFLSTQTEESCTQYNVLKIARHLFRWRAEPRYADFYERAILNGIVGNQKRGASTCGSPAGACGARGASASTSYIYMLPLGGTVQKPWGKSDYGFPCCWGTLSESFAKLSDSIFFAAPDASALYVNLFESATLEWPARPGVTVEQQGHFPLGRGPHEPWATATLRIGVADRARGERATFALKLRVPSWIARGPAEQKAVVTLNGAPVAQPIIAGSYLALEREWNDADTVELSFPAELWTAPLNDKHAWHNSTVAFMYGPLVLAGVGVATDIFVPPKGSLLVPTRFITRNASAVDRLEFIATAANGTRIRLVPLRDVVDEHYVVYFFAAGTKPPQPTVHYCPHSTSGSSDHRASGDVHTHGESGAEAELLSAGPTPAPPARLSEVAATISSAAASDPPRRGRGVRWVAAPSGQMVSVDI